MTNELAHFVSTATRLCGASIAWGGGGMPLRVAYCLSDRQPPQQYVSSVRAIVFWDQSALVVTDKRGQMYILPGGRVEGGELPIETLRREVLEETGWGLDHPEPLGFVHFRHLGPRPDDYAYPYPDFIWPVFLAEAARFERRR